MLDNVFSVILTWIIVALALYLTAIIVPSFTIKSYGSALLSAILIGLLNAIIRPVLMFLAFPINFLTLGLFTFVINAIILKIAAKILPGFDIDTWTAALIGALVLAIIQAILFYIVSIF